MLTAHVGAPVAWMDADEVVPCLAIADARACCACAVHAGKMFLSSGHGRFVVCCHVPEVRMYTTNNGTERMKGVTHTHTHTHTSSVVIYRAFFFFLLHNHIINIKKNFFRRGKRHCNFPLFFFTS
jgi:hypothetical protein